MQPKISWVARWNRKAELAPGIYAMHLKTDQYEDEDNYEGESVTEGAWRY